MQAKLVYFSVSKMSGSQGQLEQLSLLALASQGWEQEHDSRMKLTGCPQRLGRSFVIMDPRTTELDLND